VFPSVTEKLGRLTAKQFTGFSREDPMFERPEFLLQIVLRSSIVYLVILIGFRIAGKRHISQLSLVDFALVLLVSNAVQNAMVGSDVSLEGGLVAAVTLLLINILITKVLFKDATLAHWVAGEPRLLVRNGSPVQSNLDREDIRLEEVEEQIREQGIDRIAEVRAAILETDGTISVIPFQQAGTHIEHHMPFVRKKTRGRRGWRPN
jgi:uncharacterized membrane protein YcaP (DUF421 family)